MKRNWPKPGYRGTLKERLMKRVTVDSATGCWNFSTLNSRGYGVIGIGTGRGGVAHRVSYEVHVGPIPDDKELHHTCRNRGCVNPEHLEAVTRFTHQHIEPTSMANRTHCKNGHSLSGDNLLPNKLKVGKRQCATCFRAAAKRSYERHKETKRAYTARRRARINAQARARYAADPERHAGYTRAYLARKKAKQL